MSYRVLARKYRSRNFDEVLGQQAIATTLKNAIESGRVHHGYLFTGTRGVGKTSMARILAKSLNCLASDKPTAFPCGECGSCLHIAEGDDLDVLEIDAASNTGVDNIRELRGNAVYRPARGRFKIYIIDEVHMLSSGAFNALLKTLEEPPSHVKFILATTESHKVPATIQSRCQRFDFRGIDPDTIAGHLKRILEQENLTGDDRALRRVARLARGSMRDALSLLDQLVSFGGGTLTPEIVDEIIPTPHDEVVCDLMDKIAASDSAGALDCVERSLVTGYTPERFCEQLLEHLRALMLVNVCGPDTPMVDLPVHTQQRVIDQAKSFDAPTYVYMIGLVEELRRATKASATARAVLDACVVRLAMASQFTDVKTLLARLDGQQPEPTTSKPAKVPAAVAPRPAVSTPAPSRMKDVTDARPPARQVKPTASAEVAVAPSAGGVDKRRVLAQPLVRRALEIFDGQLQNLRSTGSAPGRSAEE